MATKKTTTSRTKSKTTKKTKKTVASADSGTETQLTETGGPATAPPAATKPKTRRKATKKVTTRRRKTAAVETVAGETPLAEQQETAVAELQEAPPAPGVSGPLAETAAPEPEQRAEPKPAHARTRPETAEAAARQMERQDEVLVIRFPPVAPPPFEPRPVPAAEPESAAAPPASVAGREEPLEPAVTEELEPPPAPAPPETARQIGVKDADAEADLEADVVEEQAISEPIEPAAERDEELGPTADETPREPDGGEPPGFERRGRRRRRRRRPNGHEGNGRAVQPPAEAPLRVEPQIRPRTPGGPQAAAPQEFTAPPGRHLSPSQKRRLRRRRRSQENREPEPKAFETPAPPTAPAAEEAPAEEPAPPDFDENEGVALARIPGLGDEELPSLPSLDEGEEPAEEKAAAPAQTRATGREGRGRQRPGRRPVQEPEVEEGGEAPVVGTKEMIINVVPGEECRIAILHKGKLEEMYIERASAESHVGNIYKGLVTNVEPSIQAAFVDFGLGKNGFLHVSDLHPQYFPDGGQPAENVGRKLPRRSRPPIQRCLRRGQQIIVQITKEGIGTKGPTLSTYLSIPGRFLVMMPGMRQLGVSRKIEDDEVRIKLRSQLHELELPEGMGFIARTAAQDRTKRELQSDLKYLMRLWSMITRRMKEERAPAELYRESDLVIRTIRDLYSAEIGKIVVDDAAVAQRAREFLQIFSPRAGDVVHEYTDPVPIFHRYGIEAELDRLHSRHVPLRSGGSLVIEPTEALVAIDVNSGKFRTEDDAEATAFKINMEAADEIARQLRLRDLGGVIICDFIDMRQESHKRAIERRLASNLRQHKERAKILRMSQFGIIEMTRQRQRASLTRSVYQDCRYCHGTGLVKTGESVALDVMRIIQLNIIRDPVRVIELTVSPEVANHLLNRKRAALANLEAKYRRTILIRPEPNFGLDNVEVRCSDHRGRLIPPA